MLAGSKNKNRVQIKNNFEACMGEALGFALVRYEGVEGQRVEIRCVDETR